jgi:hypothetical protein
MQLEWTGKICKECGTFKKLDEFPTARYGRLGRRNQCRKCHNAQNLRWYEQHKNDPELKEYRSNYELEYRRQKRGRFAPRQEVLDG